MTTTNLKGKIANAVLSLSLLFGIGFALSTDAQAQYRNDDYYRRQRQYEREQRRRQREIERQQRRAQRQAQRNGGYYGNDGYYNNGGYGNNGYGYRTNDGYSNYGGSFDLRQTALNAGYNNGMEEGREDRSRGDRYDYSDESDYRNANKDYSSRLGDRGTYQRYFREAFQRGYRDGYQGNTNGYYRNDGYYSPYNY